MKSVVNVHPKGPVSVKTEWSMYEPPKIFKLLNDLVEYLEFHTTNVSVRRIFPMVGPYRFTFQCVPFQTSQGPHLEGTREECLSPTGWKGRVVIQVGGPVRRLGVTGQKQP